MKDINEVKISGTCVRDAEISRTTKDKQVLKFTLAVHNWNGKEETTSFVNCVVFADNLIPEKGKSYLVEGYLKQDSLEKDGQKRSMIKVVGFKVEQIERKSKKNQSESNEEVRDFEEDIPF